MPDGFFVVCRENKRGFRGLDEYLEYGRGWTPDVMKATRYELVSIAAEFANGCLVLEGDAHERPCVKRVEIQRLPVVQDVPVWLSNESPEEAKAKLTKLLEEMTNIVNGF